MIEVDVQYAIPADNCPTEQDFQLWAETAIRSGCDTAELTIRIVGEDESASLNQTYRHKQGATNVLSFPFEAPAEVESHLLGDLVICAPVVEQEAAEQGKSVQSHWAHMVVHGSLHLLGYDHMNEADAQEMESLEVKLLESLGFYDPYNNAE